MSVELTAAELDKQKRAPDVDGVLPAFHHRWSARSFAEKSVGKADLARVFEAARWAASSMNEQPWRFIVGERGTETHSKLESALMGLNKAWAGAAPVLILGVASGKFAHNGAENTYAHYDLGAATSYLTLQAAALGLTTHQMAGYDHAKAREVLAIPDDFVMGAIVALGYQDAPGKLANEQLIQRELAPRSRKPLGELVFVEWGQPTKLD